MGPAVGGLLLEVGDWRLLFFVNLPASLLGLVTAWFFLPRSRELAPRQSFDWAGLALFVPGVSAVMLGLSLAVHDPPVWVLIGCVAAAAVFGAGFVIHARRHPSPVLDVTLFRNFRFNTGLISGLLSYTAMFGLLFTAPGFLGTTYGLSAGRAGLALTCLPAALAVVAPFAGGLSDRVGARRVTAAGMLLATAGLLIITTEPALPALLGAFAVSGSRSALLRPGPLRTVRAPHRRTRLKQAARALRVAALAACVCGLGARGGRRRVSSWRGSCLAHRAHHGGRACRWRSAGGPRPATNFPIPEGTGAAGRC